MEFSQLKEMYDEYICPSYSRFDLGIVRGKGARCWDGAGKEYIDFSAGIGVNSLGFCSDAWVQAVIGQAAVLNHTSNLYYTEPGAILAEKLCKRSGLKKVFFANSGTEANEGAIKAARKYGLEHHGPECYEILSLHQSFHGRTLGALAATGQPALQEKFGPMLGGFAFAEGNKIDDVKKHIGEKTCAVLLESIQGEGGVNNMETEFVREVAALCAEKDLLLIFDEIQTGIGRTGTLFSYEQLGVKPDIVTLAKGLGGGLPIGAILFGERCEDIFQAGDHGSTYGGNPIACAGANAVLDEMDEDFLEELRKKSTYLREKLAKIKGIKEVTGRGLMIGVVLEEKQAVDVVKKGIEKGAIFLTAKTRLRMLPPLNIGYDEIDQGLAVLETILTED